MSESDSSFQTRPSLLLRIRDAQDTASWQMFVDVYGPVLYRYGRHKGLQDADAADLMQEILTEVARCIQTFEYQPERGRFRSWLGVLARRRLGRFLERKRRDVLQTGADTLTESAAAQPDPAWTDEFNTQLLRVALERVRVHFEPDTWRAFERVWLENCPAAQAAQELQMPMEKIYVAKSRVLKRLEQEILALADDLPQHLCFSS